MVRHLLTLASLNENEILHLIDEAVKIKKNPEVYSHKMERKTLLMIFAKPSLRTRLSFEAGMTQMGGHAIYYDISTSPMGKKETIADTAKTSSRYVDIVMARLFEHNDIEDYAKNSNIPVINALTNYSHPCQILSDLLTIKEKKGKLKGLKLVYLGDSNNNVTHSLLFGCSLVGIDIYIGCPNKPEYTPNQDVVKKSKEFASKHGSKVVVTSNPIEAVKDADIVYTDSWMSYHVPKDQEQIRINQLTPYQVNLELVKHAKRDFLFMNCLPAMRGHEQTAEVIDGFHSFVFDQAENRLHMRKAIMLWLLSQ